jgi:hypothetical protein
VRRVVMVVVVMVVVWSARVGNCEGKKSCVLL